MSAQQQVLLQVDRPSGGGSYVCPHPGGYKVQHGEVRPFPQATAGPIMLVSAVMLQAHAAPTTLCLVQKYTALAELGVPTSQQSWQFILPGMHQHKQWLTTSPVTHSELHNRVCVYEC